MSDGNPYCHAGMECHDGCRCARTDGICHCKMISADKCACDGYCGVRKTI
ncbi:hypothetical protein [Companilactobacillus musae]|nr:hypothetical protein [Companilactobacillus musae]